MRDDMTKPQHPTGRMPAFRTPAALQGVALAALALAVGGCSMFGSSRPEPAALEPNVPLLAVSQMWTASVGKLGSIQLTPAINGAEVALATEQGDVLALHGTTGEVLWRVQLKDKLAAGVGSDGQTYAVVSTQNEVIAIRDGKEQWRYRLPARSYTAPYVAGGRVFALTADRTLVALDAHNGAQIWLQTRDSEPLALQTPGVLLGVQDTLLAGYSGRLAGVSPDTGAERWEAVVVRPRGINDIERLVDLVGRYSREQNDVCVQAYQTAIGCVDAYRANTRWTQRLNGAVGVHGDARTIFSVETNGRVQAWSRADGKNLWLSDRLQHRRLTAPLHLGVAVAVGDDSGILHLLSREDGSPLNRFQLDKSGISVAPVLAANTLVALTNNGTVYGFRPDR